MGKIPGWRVVSEETLTDSIIIDGGPDVQWVDGVKYVPNDGSESLQKLWDEYMELVWQDYHHHTAVGKGGKRRGVVSDGYDAIRILKELGKLDEDGHMTEETKRERGR